MIASGRAALATSGMISGFGLARAKIIGCGAMDLTISGVRMPGGRQAQEDVRALDDLGQGALVGVARVALLVRIQVGAAGVDDAFAVQARMFSGLRPSVTSMFTQEMPAAPMPVVASLTSSIFLPVTTIGVEHRRADDDRGAVLVVMEHRDLHALAQLALDLEALRAP